MEIGGNGICPVAGVLTEAHGTLHDDERSGVDCVANPQQCSGPTGSGDSGYTDNVNCFTTITAPSDGQVKLTFTQINLEQYGCHPGAGPTWANGMDGQGCPDGGCDYVAVYDGADESSPLIGKYSGQPAHLPVIVSSSTSMHIRFVTDNRNCGIAANGQTGDPGWVVGVGVGVVVVARHRRSI